MKVNLLIAITLSVFIMSSTSFADQQTQEEVELTTYYPAATGDYDGLTANTLEVGGNANLATKSGKVGIGIATPKAVLDVTSTTSGFLPPRMTTAQRDAIVSPVAGTTIFNTTTSQMEVYNGSLGWAAAGGNAVTTYFVRGTTHQTIVKSTPLAYEDFDQMTLSVPVNEGEKVQIFFNTAFVQEGPGGGGTTYFRLMRGSDQLISTGCAEANSERHLLQASIVFEDTPPAGTYTYKIQWAHNQWGATPAAKSDPSEEGVSRTLLIMKTK